MASTQASLLLQKQLKDLCKKPVDGFSAGLVDESNVFQWSVTIIGPPDSLYYEGFFNAIMNFPPGYPVNPPSVRFTSEMWHPNVYPDGKVCISILHSLVMIQMAMSLQQSAGTHFTRFVFHCLSHNLFSNTKFSGLLTAGSDLRVESIVLSIISMLSTANDESPANVDAAKEWRGRSDEFKQKVKR